VLDSPLYRKKIVIDNYKTITHVSNPICPVLYMIAEKWHFEEKVGHDPYKAIAELNEKYKL